MTREVQDGYCLVNQYDYTGRIQTENGPEIINKRIEAMNKKHAIEKLTEQGIHVMDLKVGREGIQRPIDEVL